VGFFVGLERKGCFIFQGNTTYFDGLYVQEKLNLMTADALNVADWINAQFGNKSEQQGIYNKKYILESEPNHRIYEPRIKTLCPEIVF